MAPKKRKGKKTEEVAPAGPAPKPKKPPPPPKCFTAEMIEQFKEAFLLYDEAQIQKVAKVHLPVLIRKIGFNPTNEELEKMLSGFLEDPLCDLIEFHEFLFMLEAKISWGDPIEVQVQEAFKAFDPEEKGYIDIEYLQEQLAQWGEPLSEAEFADLPRIAQREGLLPDGKLAYDLFVEKLNSKDKRFLPEPVNFWKLDQKTLLEMARKKAMEDAAEVQRLEEIRNAKEAARRARAIAEGKIIED